MKQLYSAGNAMEAHDLRLYLESHGVQAQVFGDTNAFESIIAFTPGSAPSVFVHEADWQQASELLQEFTNRLANKPGRSFVKWICNNCGEKVEPNFDLCWNCGKSRQEETSHNLNADTTVERLVESDAAPSPQTQLFVETSDDVLSPALTSEQKKSVWIEVAVVLSVAWFHSFSRALLYFLGQVGHDVDRTFAVYSLSIGISMVPPIAVVLYIISQSGESWDKFGIRRPRWLLDPILGVLILIATYAVIYVVAVFIAAFAGHRYASDAEHLRHVFTYPSTGSDYLSLVLMSIAVGLGEELAMRSYLITRLEQLLNSSAQGVLISSLLFASYHIYQGLRSTFWVFVLGLCFGTAYCRLRRIWPLVAAHALADILAIAMRAGQS